MKPKRSLPRLVYWHTFGDGAGFGENSLAESLKQGKPGQNLTPEHPDRQTEAALQCHADTCNLKQGPGRKPGSSSKKWSSFMEHPSREWLKLLF